MWPLISTLAIHAAWQAISIKLFIRLLSIWWMSDADADVWKSSGIQSARRTAASALLNVRSGFGYQLAMRGIGAAFAYRSWAHSVSNENNPSSAGVVRSIAGSDHCRCGSRPK